MVDLDPTTQPSFTQIKETTTLVKYNAWRDHNLIHVAFLKCPHWVSTTRYYVIC